MSNGDAAAETENLGRWGSLRENKGWATFTGLCAINDGRSLGEPRGNQRAQRPLLACAAVLMAGVANGP